MAKHTRRKGRLVLNHSSFIGDLRPALEAIASWPEVINVTPGHIRRGAHGTLLTIKIKEDTDTGLRCLASAHGSIQRFFIVTKDREGVRKRIEANEWQT